LDVCGNTSSWRKQWLEFVTHANKSVRHADDNFAGKQIDVLLRGCCRTIPRGSKNDHVARRRSMVIAGLKVEV
jgi:hypothetical protein